MPVTTAATMALEASRSCEIEAFRGLLDNAYAHARNPAGAVCGALTGSSGDSANGMQVIEILRLKLLFRMLDRCLPGDAARRGRQGPKNIHSFIHRR